MANWLKRQGKPLWKGSLYQRGGFLIFSLKKKQPTKGSGRPVSGLPGRLGPVAQLNKLLQHRGDGNQQGTAAAAFSRVPFCRANLAKHRAGQRRGTPRATLSAAQSTASDHGRGHCLVPSKSSLTHAGAFAEPEGSTGLP